MADDKRYTAPDIAKELEVKPSVFRAWLRANGYQKQPGVSYSFTRKEATAIKKVYAEATAPKEVAPVKKSTKKAKAPIDPTPAEEVDEVPDDDIELDDDDDVEEVDYGNDEAESA